MTTYLLITSDKPTELTAFVGPKEPEIPSKLITVKGVELLKNRYISEMDRAKETRLPVVNCDDFEVMKAIQTALGISHGEGSGHEVENAQMFVKHVMKHNEPYPLEGWEMDTVYQVADSGVFNTDWRLITKDKFDHDGGYLKRQAYRLVRSEPVKSGVDLIREERQRQISVEGWSIAHDDCYTNYEEAAKKAFLKDQGGNIEYWTTKIDDPDAIYWMEVWLKGCSHAHSKIEEADREGYNRCLNDIEIMIKYLPNPTMPHSLAKDFLIEELKKLRR